MAYYVKGKAYTDNPLMDEICFNCKRILDGIIIKNDVLANNKETDNSIKNYEMYKLYKEYGSISFELYPYDKALLSAFGYDNESIEKYLKDKNSIPIDDREALTKFSNQYFLDNYFYSDGRFIEENDYYRMLMGLPPYNTGEEYYIWLTELDIPNKYEYLFDPTLPLHEQSKKLIEILYINGVIEKLKSTYIGSKYSYMNYLGDKSINLDLARSASKWDILYMPNINQLVKDKFTDFYKINRDIYINRSYQDFYAQNGEYYDQSMILIVLAQTFADMVTDTPEWYIRRDIFDIRSCKYYLESNGVEFFKEIPLKYQIRIVKNLNKLIKYKSTKQNMQDILDIFDIPDTKIFKYWLYKKKVDKSEYDLEFISSEIGESYDNYMKDSRYRTQYDSLTLADKYWDGELDHDYVKEQILDQEFTIRGTKYMSIEYNVDLSKYLYQMEYMLGLILDSNANLSDITIGVPSINEFAKFEIGDLFIFLMALTNNYSVLSDQYNSSTKVRIPNMWEGTEPEVCEKYYDWKKKYFPEMFVRKEGRINGYNSNLDKDKLISILERRHSHFIFGLGEERNSIPLAGEEYKKKADEWIEEMGVYDFIIPNIDISTIDDLMTIYNNNTKYYNKLRDMIFNADNQDDKKTLEYVYQELYTREFDIDYYKNSSTGLVMNDLIDVLKDHNYILYEEYNTIMKETNIESRQDMIRSIMNDVIDTMEYYLSGEGLDFLYSFTSNESFGAIVRYIYLMINFFKSYKIYFLDPYITFTSSDKIENNVAPIDRISSIRFKYHRYDRAFVSDYITSIRLQKFVSDKSIRDKMYEKADIYSHYTPTLGSDNDYDGKYVEDLDEYKDINGGTSDDAQTVPYIMVNGGITAGRPNVNLSNIDGGEPDEKSREYFEVDGGGVYDKDVMKTDAFGAQLFTYIIDGGSPNGRRFITNSVDVKLIGTELFMNIIKSNKNNLLQILDDGLFVDGNTFANGPQFNNLVSTVIELSNWVRTEGEEMAEDFEVLTDYDKVIARIKKLVNAITYNMEYVNDQVTLNNTFEDNLIAYINYMNNVLYNNNKDKVNPYAWEEL